MFAEFYDTSIRTWSTNWSRPSDRTGATGHTWTRATPGAGSASGSCPAACTEGAQASAQTWQKGAGSAKGSEKAPKTLIECLGIRAALQ